MSDQEDYKPFEIPKELFEGICSMCNQPALLRIHHLGHFCINCQRAVRHVKFIACPVCKTTVSVSRVQQHYEKCPDPSKRARVAQ